MPSPFFFNGELVPSVVDAPEPREMPLDGMNWLQPTQIDCDRTAKDEPLQRLHEDFVDFRNVLLAELGAQFGLLINQVKVDSGLHQEVDRLTQSLHHYGIVIEKLGRERGVALDQDVKAMRKLHPPATPTFDCDEIGHEMEETAALSTLQTLHQDFAEFRQAVLAEIHDQFAAEHAYLCNLLAPVADRVGKVPLEMLKLSESPRLGLGKPYVHSSAVTDAPRTDRSDTGQNSRGSEKEQRGSPRDPRDSGSQRVSFGEPLTKVRSGSIASSESSGSKERPKHKKANKTKAKSFRERTTDDFDDEKWVKDLKKKVNGAFGALFVQETNMEGIEASDYQVEDHYKVSGWCQKVARSERFFNITLSLIVLNALYLGVEAELNTPERRVGGWFTLCDNLFCVYFCAELAVRYFAFEHKVQCLQDGWFRFDLMLVLIMVIDTWVLTVMILLVDQSGFEAPIEPFRLIRALRLTRVSRLMRAMPELVTMTRGMLMAARAVVSSMLMSVLLIYTFSILLNTILREETELNDLLGNRGFQTVYRCMWTLFVDGTLLDEPGIIMTELLFFESQSARLACVVFSVFILISAILLMNLLIGVLCEVVSEVAKSERDESAVKLVKQTILVTLKAFDDGDGLISRRELELVMEDPVSKAVLRSLNVDLIFLTELVSMLYKKSDDTVSIKGILELMLMCRGDLPSTVQHVASGQAFLHTIISQLENRVIRMQETLSAQIAGKDSNSTPSPKKSRTTGRSLIDDSPSTSEVIFADLHHSDETSLSFRANVN